MLKLCISVKLNAWYLRSLEKLAIKVWFPINFAKTLKDCDFVVVVVVVVRGGRGGSKSLKISTKAFFSFSFQKNVFWSFLLFSSVICQDDLSDSERHEIASLTTCNFNNNWFLYVEFLETINLRRNIWLTENWKSQLFLILKQKATKRTKFSIF